MAIAHSSRRRPLQSAAVAAVAVVTTLGNAGKSLCVQAQAEFTGVGSAYTSRDAIAANCSSSSDSASDPNFVTVNSALFACGRCVQLRWRWCSASEPDCRWASNVTETLRVAGQCADCSVGDLSFSAAAYTRVMGTRDAGDLQDPVSITWQFTDCPTQQPETDSHTPTPPPSTVAPAPTGNATAPTNAPSPVPSHNSNSTSLVTPLPSPTLTPAATNATARAPAISPPHTPYTQSPPSHPNSTDSNDSTGSAGCSTPEAGSLSDNKLLPLRCNESATSTTPMPAAPTTPTTGTPSPKPALLPTASKTPPVPSTSDAGASAIESSTPAESVVVVETKSFAAMTSKSRTTDSITTAASTSTRVIARASGDAETPAAMARSPSDDTVAIDGTSDKATQFRAISNTISSTTTRAIDEPAPAPAIDASSVPKKKASTSDAEDEEIYAPSTSGSSASDSKNKRKTSSNDTNANSSRTSDDSSTSGRTNSDKLLKNPFFFSSVLLAVVGFVGAVVAYRAKERKQRRHVHQQVAWRQYSQRVQSALSHSALGTPSPGGVSDMGDAYIVSSTTRHASSSSPAVAAATALRPTPFGSLTPRASSTPCSHEVHTCNMLDRRAKGKQMASSSSNSSKLLPLGAVRTQDGEVVVPASRRADGSVRKPIRIRQGYVPQDEVPKYKTVAQRRREQEMGQQHTSANGPELLLQSLSLSLESKVSSAASDQQTPSSEADQRNPRPISSAPPTASQAVPAPERKSATPGSAAATNSQEQRNAELKQELSKLNKLLKEIGKLEAQQEGGEGENKTALTQQQQRKVERKQELQRKRNEIIAELNGVAINSASNSSRSASTSGPGATKKTFVAIEM